MHLFALIGRIVVSRTPSLAGLKSRRNASILEANHVKIYILDMMLTAFVLTGKNCQLISAETLILLQTPNIGTFRVL